MVLIYIVIGVGLFIGLLALSANLMIEYGEKWERYFLMLSKKDDSNE